MAELAWQQQESYAAMVDFYGVARLTIVGTGNVWYGTCDVTLATGEIEHYESAYGETREECENELLYLAQSIYDDAETEYED